MREVLREPCPESGPALMLQIRTQERSACPVPRRKTHPPPHAVPPAGFEESGAGGTAASQVAPALRGLHCCAAHAWASGKGAGARGVGWCRLHRGGCGEGARTLPPQPLTSLRPRHGSASLGTSSDGRWAAPQVDTCGQAEPCPLPLPLRPPLPSSPWALLRGCPACGSCCWSARAGPWLWGVPRTQAAPEMRGPGHEGESRALADLRECCAWAPNSWAPSFWSLFLQPGVG